MKITFRHSKHQRAALHLAEAAKLFGDKATRYIDRIQLIQNANSLDELRKTPRLRFHALKGGKKGFFGIDLTKNEWRIEVSLDPQNSDTIVIEDVNRHYGS